jgi:hypothetical protein
MKNLALITLFLAISFSLTSCFLFKGGSGNSKPCPAYGQEKLSNSIDEYANNSINYKFKPEAK